VPRTFINATTGWLVERWAGSTFFLLCAAAGRARHAVVVARGAVEEDEVLGAEWTPASPELQLGLQEVQHRAATSKEVDAEAFLAAMYRNQQ
jgi:hypothetical protein